MSVVAYDGVTLAADSQLTINDCRAGAQYRTQTPRSLRTPTIRLRTVANGVCSRRGAGSVY